MIRFIKVNNAQQQHCSVLVLNEAILKINGSNLKTYECKCLKGSDSVEELLKLLSCCCLLEKEITKNFYTEIKHKLQIGNLEHILRLKTTFCIALEPCCKHEKQVVWHKYQQFNNIFHLSLMQSKSEVISGHLFLTSVFRNHGSRLWVQVTQTNQHPKWECKPYSK